MKVKRPYLPALLIPLLITQLSGPAFGRYFDPSAGRFISPDPIVPSASQPQSLNRYAYVDNNPMVKVDPSGNIPVLAVVAIGAAIGSATGGTHGQPFNRHAWKNFDWSSALIGAAGGAAAGGVGAGVAGALGGTGLGAMGLAGDIAISGLSGAAAGGTGYAVPTILTQSNWNWGAFGNSALFGGALGVATGGLTSQNLKPFLKGQQTFTGGLKSLHGLPPEMAATFRDGKFRHMKLKSDVEAYRFWGGEDALLEGRYLTTRQTAGQIQNPDQAIKILNLPNNMATNRATFKIPKGSDIYIGRVKDGSINATQIIIKNKNMLILQENITYDSIRPFGQ